MKGVVLAAFLLVSISALACGRPQVSLQVEPQVQPVPAVQPPRTEQRPQISPPRTQGSSLTYPAVGPAPIPDASEPEPVAVDAPTGTPVSLSVEGNNKDNNKENNKETKPAGGVGIHLEQVHDVMDRNNDKIGCPKLYLPVCASNGKTFNTECELNMAIRSDSSLSKTKDGQC